jgi:NAD(P)-dependent dehydrogenase (short-subunit alcohol dehydrogenase family)
MSQLNKIYSLAGKVVIVIGGTGKVGKPIVNSLLRNGALVISASTRIISDAELLDDLNLNLSNNLRQFSCDITTESGVFSLKSHLDALDLKPDVLINALSYRPMESYLSDSLEKWDNVVLKNSRSLFILYSTFGNLFKKRGGGSIINISTIYALVAPDPDLYENLPMGTEADYPFIKAGGIALTRYFASYFGSGGVRFNSIVLGGVINNQDPELIKRYVKKVPLGRMANNEDVCGAVLLLASNASSYITGTSICIDGGYTSR